MGETGIRNMSAVGIFPGGNAECGAADLAGNVDEWCRTIWLDNYEDYQKKVNDSFEGEEARVLRGGSFYFNRRSVRCAHRYGSYPDVRSSNVGFRVVSPGL